MQCTLLLKYKAMNVDNTGGIAVLCLCQESESYILLNGIWSEWKHSVYRVVGPDLVETGKKKKGLGKDRQ